VLGSLPTGSTATTFTFDAPTGAFYVRVHALTAAGRSGASNEIRIAVNLPQLPSPPTGLLGLANGANLALSWKTTSTGGPPTSHLLDVSGASTLSVPLPAGETFSFAGVPPGTYTFAVRAVNVTGASPPSPTVTLTFPSACPGPPQEPANFAVSRAGSQLTLSWDPPLAGPAVSRYVVRATGALNLTLTLDARTISGVVPAGTYNLSVLAVNPCGSGIETVPQSVTVP
jgi:predicted phage tail protein